MKNFFWNLVVTVALPIFFMAALLPSRKRDTYVWGSRPLISFSYWARAIRSTGVPSITIMQDRYAINRPEDFDRYFISFAPGWMPHLVRMGLGTCGALLFVLRRAKVLHLPFDGFALNASIYWRLEAYLLRLAGVRTVALPYGADGYVYSRMIDISMRHGLLASYPALARREAEIGARVAYWCRHADVVIPGFMIDGVGRWDVLLNTIFAIDTSLWTAKTAYSDADGTTGPVRVMHTPNHRGFKGTEFLLDAVAQLRAEGLDIELVLLERVPNETVRQTMQEVDILAEQFIGQGYALSGIEGMASGLPVLANLEHEAFTTVFRRYGFLDECPIVSSPPERLKANLKTLTEQPALRRELGQAGRAFVEKYHSFDTARYMFGAVYRHLEGDEEVDLMTLFHPLNSAFNLSTPRVSHPLVRNSLPGTDQS